MSKLKLNLKIVTNIVLINCDRPRIPQVYRLFGTINKLIDKDEISIPIIHFVNLNHPQLNNLNILNLLILFCSIFTYFFSNTFCKFLPPITIK